MTKIKSMGTEYKLITKGPWEQVAEANRITRAIIKKNQQKLNSFDNSKRRLENKILTAYSSPHEGESFADYKDRFNQIYLGARIRGKITQLFLRNQISLYFHLIENKGENTLKVESITREREYQATISASGDYSEKGALIATGLKEALERNSIPCSYKTLDKLI